MLGASLWLLVSGSQKKPSYATGCACCVVWLCN